MRLLKINTYLSLQICKYFFLILFIFLSISWILQLTRLLTITNFINIETIDIIILSFYLIPNIITIIVPFILIFGLLLCFIKLNNDNELIAILSLGQGLKHFKKVFVFFSFGIVIFFSVLNFYISPKIYEQYKIKEFNLRNTIDFNKMTYTNFLNVNKTTILDFNKVENGYEDIFISFKDKKDNLIYAKKGNIYFENNEYNFQLFNGFKISINNEEQIEKLEFLNYLLKIENKSIKIKKINDKNTFTIFDDLKSKNHINIAFKVVDLILILFVIILFYYYNLRNLNFKTNNNIFFSLICVVVLILNQILKNSQVNILNYSLVIFVIVGFSLIITFFKYRYEKN